MRANLWVNSVACPPPGSAPKEVSTLEFRHLVGAAALMFGTYLFKEELAKLLKRSGWL